MKSALPFLFLAVLFLSPQSASAKTIKSFKDSYAITTIAQFMYDVAEDVPMSIRLSDRKMNVKDFSGCDSISSRQVLRDVESAIKKVLRYYPDEEVPFEEALDDFEDYLDGAKYYKCQFSKKYSQSKMITNYYVDTTNKIHLRVDNITLLTE